MDAGQLLGLPSEILLLWHNHRTEFLVSAGVLLAILRLTVELRKPRRQHILIEPEVSSQIGHNQDEAKPSNRRNTEPLGPGGIDLEQPIAAVVRSKHVPKRVTGNRQTKNTTTRGDAEGVTPQIQPMIFYFSIAGSTKARAQSLATSLSESNTGFLPAKLHDLVEIDYDDYFVAPPRPSQKSGAVAHFYVLLIPSYDIDTELANFLSSLQETHNDFRIDTAPLSSLAGYSVLGFGDTQEWPTEAKGFCSQAIDVDRWMAKLTAGKRAFPLGLVDVGEDAVEQRLNEWTRGVMDVMLDLAQGKGLGEGLPGSGNAFESDEDEDALADEEPTSSLARVKRKVDQTPDLEDMKAPIPVDFTTTTHSAPKAMVPKSSPTYASLTKQGYSIVGTHSGVKICRWTKSALRGRGSCYKFSFYGIASHRCMEATPSLSCSNKCVFCWRHGTNPVGTTWRWQVDPPDMIFDGIKKEHYKKIKMLRGVPGVRAERFEEGMRIRHCALSLVGEPIFYPHINELLAMLHKEHISSFLVCNAQHPDQLAALGPVTQLYVSIDASNKESLRRIDRPLHRDYWERFLRCMDILREKRNTHRTVFRLTLVKGFNVEEEAEGYADLVQRALPAFVEVKGVTYCGTSTAAGAGLTMQNVPFYEEVVAFVLALEAALAKRGLDYGIGAEHAHSCCILLADRHRFHRVPTDSTDGVKKWHTLIDYDTFFSLLESGNGFAPEDYIGQPTAEWALWGKGGFDPRDERVDRKGRVKEVAQRV